MSENKEQKFCVPKASNCGKVSYPLWLTKRLKEYDKELIHKLPNDLRWALKNNYTGTTDYCHKEYIHGFF